MTLAQATQTAPRSGARPASAAGVKALLALFVSMLATAGCAPTQPTANGLEVGKPPTAVFDVPAARVHQAAKEGMLSLSCTTQEEQPLYMRVRFSSGEVVELFLRESASGRTQLLVKNHRTYVGGAWQKDRTEDVLWAVRRGLGMNDRTAVAPPSQP